MTNSATTATAPSTPASQHGAFEGVEALAATLTTCTVYPGLCTVTDGQDGTNTDENGQHFDHGSDAIGVPGLEVEGDPEIWAQFTHVSAGTPPHIGFMGFDLTPEQAHDKATELRRFADDLDHLADQVHVARALHNLRTVRETADGPFAKILTIMEDAIVRDGADPVEVGDRILELMGQARAEKAEVRA